MMFIFESNMLGFQSIFALKPLLDRLANLGAEMMEVVLDGVSMASIERTLKELGTVKDNLRTAIARNTQQQAVAG